MEVQGNLAIFPKVEHIIFFFLKVGIAAAVSIYAVKHEGGGGRINFHFTIVY